MYKNVKLTLTVSSEYTITGIIDDNCNLGKLFTVSTSGDYYFDVSM